MTEPKLPTFVMDLKSISLLPTAYETPDIVELKKEDGFFLNSASFNDFRVRRVVYDKLKEAQKHIPSDLYFMIYEGYRRKEFQEIFWARINKDMREKYPDASEEEITLLTETFIANPYDGIGSGHMAACAIDITLCDGNGVELDMGTAMHEMNEYTATKVDGLSQDVIKNRMLLCTVLENAGLLNYPAEWWHYSYGDHQWAWLAGKKEALYGPIDI